MGEHCATPSVLTHSASTLVAAGCTYDWKLNALKAHEALANVIIGGGINEAALSIAEEFIQGVISSTFPDFIRVVIELLGLIDSIINRPIC